MNNLDNQNKKATLERRYATARYDVLIIFVFTVLNILMAVFDGSYYLLFSAYVPYVITLCGMVFCGMYPDEFYTGDWADMNFIKNEYFAIFIIVALAITSLYLLAFFLSKKPRVGWLIFSLVFISLDTILIFFIFSPEFIVDLVIRAFMIVGLSIGIASHFKLKKLPAEESATVNDSLSINLTTTLDNTYNPVYSETGDSQTDNRFVVDSPILRKADFEVKARVFLEYEIFGHKIIYRRVKKTNELIVDGNVYDEYIARMEFWHTLNASVDGHLFSAGILQMTSRSFIAVDGKIVKEKIRIF